MTAIFRFGLKTNPQTSSGDDFIDLNAATLTPGKFGGYWISGKDGLSGDYIEGVPYMDTGDAENPATNLMVRDLTITLHIEGADRADVASKYRAIQRYITLTESYFRPFKGNYPASTDGSWHEGKAATLSMQWDNTRPMIYWEVLRGDLSLLPGNLLTGSNTSVIATLTLTVNETARGNETLLDNLVFGDFSKPFNPYNTLLCADYVFPVFVNTSIFSVDATMSKFGEQCLKWVGTTSSTFYTNALPILFATGIKGAVNTGDVLYPTFWQNGNVVTGGPGATLEVYDGATWNTRGTMNTPLSLSTPLTFQQCTMQSTSYTVVTGETYARLRFTTPIAGTIRYSGVAIYRNLKTTTLPTEYVSCGGNGRMPQLNAYSIKGDVPAPFTLRTKVDSGIASPPNFILTNPSLMIGGMTINPLVDKPINLTDWKPTGADVGFTDDFTRANSTTTVGTGYTNVTGTWGINGNQAYSVTDAPGDLMIISSTVAQGMDFRRYTDVSGTFNSLVNGRFTRVVFSYLNVNNYLYADLAGGTGRISKVDGGTVSTLSQWTTTTLDATVYNLRIDKFGNSVTLFKDGVLLGTHVLGTAGTVGAGIAGDTKYAGYRQFGFGLGKPGAPATAARFDNDVITLYENNFYFGGFGPTVAQAAAGTAVATFDIANPKIVDKRNRSYLLLAELATNNNITPLNFYLNAELSTYNDTFAGNYATNTPPYSSNVFVYRMGNIDFTQAGTLWQNDLFTLGFSLFDNQLQATYTTTNNQFTLNGILFLPTEQFNFIEPKVTQTTSVELEMFNHGTAQARVALISQNTGQRGDLAASGTAAELETSKPLTLMPDEIGGIYTRFEMLWLSAHDSTYINRFTGISNRSFQASIRYWPRYISGLV